MVATHNRIVAWPLVSSDLWRDMTPHNGASNQNAPAWTPRAVLTESDEAYTLKLEIPGADATTLNVELEGEFLVVSGHVPGVAADSNEKVLLSESPWGAFARRFRIRSAVDRDAISAEYVDGLLTIRVPKHQAARPKRIPVTTSAA
ncbi:MAG: Hsp20/alpha crystallin family protein [Gemmatimonadetes bacterium]|nr:Hsp20/alpha crystallin family protein [Gemmatimonadota bacterium]NNM32931.1 Hsp20/alpha crystallin family protein [Gemmatimonadota bacterium]